MIRAEFKIFGLVQGVGFRYFVYRKAIELGIVGYVKNLYDGIVLVVAEGETKKLEELHRHLQIGPSHSYVKKVDVEYSHPLGTFKGFTIQ